MQFVSLKLDSLIELYSSFEDNHIQYINESSDTTRSKKELYDLVQADVSGGTLGFTLGSLSANPMIMAGTTLWGAVIGSVIYEWVSTDTTNVKLYDPDKALKPIELLDGIKYSEIGYYHNNGVDLLMKDKYILSVETIENDPIGIISTYSEYLSNEFSNEIYLQLNNEAIELLSNSIKDFLYINTEDGITSEIYYEEAAIINEYVSYMLTLEFETAINFTKDFLNITSTSITDEKSLFIINTSTSIAIYSRKLWENM